MSCSKSGVALLALLGIALMAGPAAAQSSGEKAVGKQPPITIEINASPWYGGYSAMVGRYEKETGNKVTLDVTPFNGMREKARDAVRSGTSPYDLINLTTLSSVEFYEGGFLQALTEIEPGFKLPPEALACGDSNYWNAAKRYRTPNGGLLMGVHPNCNVHVLFYRKDLFSKADLAAPKTYDDVLAACHKLQHKPQLYGFITRGERGNGIRYDWMPFMLGYGASIVKDAENGDYTVTVNSQNALAALTMFTRLLKECGPANAGSVGQADEIQLMATGKVATMQAVIAAWANLEDPHKSAVVGQIGAVIDPAPAGGTHGVVSGDWTSVIPKNLPPERQKAALAFLKWFIGKDVQRDYAEAGGLPVRSDVLTELASQPKFFWMTAYDESEKVAKQTLGYVEAPQVEQVLGLRLNQAVIGELSPAVALNKAAQEIHDIFVGTGRKTGLLPPLPE